MKRKTDRHPNMAVLPVFTDRHSFSRFIRHKHPPSIGVGGILLKSEGGVERSDGSQHFALKLELCVEQS